MNIRLATLLLTLVTPLMAAEPIWVDVRSVEEYQQDHLPGAVLIPHTHIARGVSEQFPNRNTPINLYGADGRRSRMAMEALQALGYSRVEDFGSLSQLRGEAPAPMPTLQPASHSLPLQ
ncbi:rhodanese-like domain-containing protein [Oceanimonas sp. CHS3-5]|uniref:rhodanese-like domain-containing protein n=1 Tax=Oceanimonas sp. CHS3-5 TaxID=3068186 RepID=UPI00273FDC47|nr:rhodanese-like domain-containing protein [Oceanimonas sp. CHS3-5]MDP5291456.1 rhodanese-like domain-containing protein [Oceanimonas sp. CHS3-5]